VIGVSVPTTAYNVYDVKPDVEPGSRLREAAPPSQELRRTAAASAEAGRPAATTSAAGQTPREKKHQEIRLTTQPVAEARFVDNRVVWGVERCYAVRVARTFDGLTVESDASPPRCVTPADTFPPKPPTGLQAIASEGAISLIWEPNTEKDLAGYVVLRAAAPSSTMAPVTPTPILATTLRDPVRPGVRYVYAVEAVDKAGNTSAPSSRSEETEAR
jgi:fibronectin type 3 domain-containing protein